MYIRDTEDLVVLIFDAADNFSSAGHYPLIAGYTEDSRPLFYSVDHERLYKIAIPNGYRPERLKIRTHYTDGSTDIKMLGSFRVYALRYEPHAYEMCEKYSSPGENANGMDATGPFAWNFHKKLPDHNKAREGDVRPDRASAIRAPGFLWNEILIEPLG